jgi:hypothetical protein
MSLSVSTTMFYLSIAKNYIFRPFPLLFKEAQLSKLKRYPNIQVYTTLGSKVYNTMSLDTAKINKFKNYINFNTCQSSLMSETLKGSYSK